MQSDTLSLVDIFEKFHNKCIKIYELNPAYFLSATGLTWQACLKKTEVEFEFLTDVDVPLLVKKESEVKSSMSHINMKRAPIDT